MSAPVEELREAARLMRERAEASIRMSDAYPEVTGGRHAHRTPAAIGDAFKSYFWGDSSVAGYDTSIEADAEHLAPWHPAVALAVADWLDSAASGYMDDEPLIDAALVVARAYLGSTP